MPIVITGLTHSYMEGSPLAFPALKDITMTVNEGEFLGVIGHTGSGKSTLMQHLNGLLLPTGGRITVDGLDTLDKKQRIAARRLVGMVFQYPEYQLFEETVRQDVAFGPKNLDLSDREVEERVESSLRLVGLDPDAFGEKSPFDLSGGEKRRAALAGILAMRPKYLVLDEPMAGLDPRGRREILDMIQAMRETYGTTIVMVSHSMDDVSRCADRIAVLCHGQLSMIDTPASVFARADELIQMGLDIPQATQLAELLRQRGMDIPAGIYRMDELKTVLVARWQDGK